MAKTVTLENLSVGKLEEWLSKNPDAPRLEIKRAKRLIRLSKDEEKE